MESEEFEPKFPAFPYKPYSIQMDLMKALHRSLNKGGVSMLESPTNIGAEGRIRRTKASSGCLMLRKHKLQREFRNEVSEQGVLDIEDLVQLRRSIGTCPYYGSRPAADLVVLPYQSLLSKSAREMLGLYLKNNIVITDESHNLADSEQHA